MLNVVCLKVGPLYTADHVHALHAQFKRHLGIPHKFYCITDDSAGLRCKVLKEETGLPGWWGKLGLFRPDPYGLEGPILFSDLDNLIVGNIDDMAISVGSLFAVEDFSHPGQFNSAFFLMRPGAYPEVWTDFRPEYIHKHRYAGDQDWITPRVNFLRWGQSNVVSYKRDAQGGPLPGARVVCFHGEPKPWKSGGWAQKHWEESLKLAKFSAETRQDAPEQSPRPLTTTQTPLARPSASNGEMELVSFLGRGGQIRWRCPDCDYDSYKEALVAKHWLESHGKAQWHLSGPTLFDSEDKPIEKGKQVIEAPASIQRFLENL